MPCARESEYAEAYLEPSRKSSENLRKSTFVDVWLGSKYAADLHLFLTEANSKKFHKRPLIKKYFGQNRYHLIWNSDSEHDFSMSL